MVAKLTTVNSVASDHGDHMFTVVAILTMETVVAPDHGGGFIVLHHRRRRSIPSTSFVHLSHS